MNFKYAISFLISKKKLQTEEATAAAAEVAAVTRTDETAIQMVAEEEDRVNNSTFTSIIHLEFSFT